MTEPSKTYADREIDEKFQDAFDRMARFDKDARESLTRLEVKIETLTTKVEYTNGKVKRITMILIGLAAFSIGVGLSSPGNLITIFHLFAV